MKLIQNNAIIRNDFIKQFLMKNKNEKYQCFVYIDSIWYNNNWLMKDFNSETTVKISYSEIELNNDKLINIIK